MAAVVEKLSRCKGKKLKKRGKEEKETLDNYVRRAENESQRGDDRNAQYIPLNCTLRFFPSRSHKM